MIDTLRARVGATSDRVVAILRTEDGWDSFTGPSCVIAARHAREVREALAHVEGAARDRGEIAVGFVAYEAAEAFEARIVPRRGDDDSGDPPVPFVWFALFSSERRQSAATLTALLAQLESAEAPDRYELGDIRASLEAHAFVSRFEIVKAHIAQGDTYQANLTFRLDASFAGSALQLFADLAEAQDGRYSAFISTGDHAICSASPELFFRRSGGLGTQSRLVEVRPMKGTTRRGRTLREDEHQASALRHSPKERAENVMIVDMVRNDLGRIADVGSVEVPELFRTERYPSVWQMTSCVRAKSPASLVDLFAAMHPPASVTGAPKLRTMEILAGLEDGPRGVYTGAVGFIQADGAAQFNVAIRTAVVHARTGRVSFGVGSGIVWDSAAEAEYEECLLKGSVLGRRRVSFDLLETMRWTRRGGYFLCARHLERLRASSEYFGFVCDTDRVHAALNDAATQLSRGVGEPGEDDGRRWRVRVLLSRDGTVRTETYAVPHSPEPLRATLAREPVDEHDVFLFHKTTNRAMYEHARVEGYDEAVLWNRRGDVTEGLTTNVVAELDGVRVTPPVECGLLAGTFRAEILERGEVEERRLTIDDLRRSSRIWLVNSVHEWRRAEVTW